MRVDLVLQQAPGGGVQAHLFAVAICSMFAKRIGSCRSVFSWKYESEVAGLIFPGMGETATFDGSVMLQTHG